MEGRLIFDGECGFCKRWIRRWQTITGDRVEYLAYQDVAREYPQIPEEDFARAVHFVAADGSVVKGAEAVFASLRSSSRWGWLTTWYERVPGFAPVTEFAYRLVARNRRSLSRLG